MSNADIMDASGLINGAYLAPSQRVLVYSLVNTVETRPFVNNLTGVAQPGLLSVYYFQGNGAIGTGATQIYWSSAAAEDGTEINYFTLANSVATGSPNAMPLPNNTICCVLPAGLASQITLFPGAGFTTGSTTIVKAFWTPLNAGAISVTSA
jgi:hypothetical protein